LPMTSSWEEEGCWRDHGFQAAGRQQLQGRGRSCSCAATSSRATTSRGDVLPPPAKPPTRGSGGRVGVATPSARVATPSASSPARKRGSSGRRPRSPAAAQEAPVRAAPALGCCYHHRRRSSSSSVAAFGVRSGRGGWVQQLHHLHQPRREQGAAVVLVVIVGAPGTGCFPASARMDLEVAKNGWGKG
jgi:hypothetical protein